MTVPMGGNRINPHPCTEQEELQNWQNTSIYVSNIQNNIDVIEGDIENIENTYYNDPDQLFSDITLDGATYNSSTNTLTIETGGGGVDNYTVLVTVNDSVASYLHDAFTLNATYDSTADLLVATETVGGSGTNQTERLFVDLSIISNYGGSAVQLLGHDNDTTRLDTVSNWLFEMTDYDDAKRQVIQHKVSEEAKWVEGGVPILVKITGTISARSGTTLGSGTAQEVDPADLTSDIGAGFNVYNLSPRALDGSIETVYARAVRIKDRFFIDCLDPSWFLNYTGVADGSGLGFDGGVGSTNLVFRQVLEDVQVDEANDQLEKKVFGGSFTDYHTGEECA